MRMQVLIFATLAAAGCSSSSSDSAGCPEAEPFTIDEMLSEATVKDLLAANDQTDPAMLECEQVCSSIYRESMGNTVSITACELTIDGEFTDMPEAIVGAVQCEGTGEDFCIGGRRPLGHIACAPADAGLPAFLAHGARIEAASVLAFSQLADRLLGWGAPAALVERCRVAAEEEAVHAELLGALAREAGATVEPSRCGELPVDLACAALDNAVEGCVNEAWAALVCAVMARRAEDPALRDVYARLAADEVGHAQLAWDLHTWFMGQVSPAQRVTIVDAQRAAIAGLPAVAWAQQRAAPPALGLPDARVAACFGAGLARAA